MKSLARQQARERPDALQELTRRRPGRVFFDAAYCWGLIAVAFALLAAAPAAWSAVVAFLVIGNRQYALSVMAHDGKHGNLLPERRWNDLFTIVVLCVAIGVDFHGEWSNHRAHHRHLGTDEDPDRRLYAAADKATPAGFLLFLTVVGTFARLHSRARRPQPFVLGFVAYRWPILAAQAVIFAAIAALFPWWYYPVFWIAPILCLMFAPHKVRMFCEHAQPILPDHAADARRLITYRPGLVERVLISPMNVNFHAEHHLWSSVPYYNLPRMCGLVAPDAGIEVRSSFAAFLWTYYRQLPLTLTART